MTSTATTETPCATCAGTGDIATAPRFKTSTPCPDCSPKEGTMTADLFLAASEASNYRSFSSNMDALLAHPEVKAVTDALEALREALFVSCDQIPITEISAKTAISSYGFDAVIKQIANIRNLGDAVNNRLSERFAMAHTASTQALQSLVGKYLNLHDESVPPFIRYGWDRVGARDWAIVLGVSLKKATEVYPNDAGVAYPQFEIRLEGLNKNGARSKCERTVTLNLEQATGLFNATHHSIPEVEKAKLRKPSRKELEAELERLRAAVPTPSEEVSE